MAAVSIQPPAPTCMSLSTSCRITEKFGAVCKQSQKFDTNSMKILSHGLGEDEIQGFLKTYKNSLLISCHKGKPAYRVETGKKRELYCFVASTPHSNRGRSLLVLPYSLLSACS